MTHRYLSDCVVISLLLTACQSAQPPLTMTPLPPTDRATTPAAEPSQTPPATTHAQAGAAPVTVQPAATARPTPEPLGTTGPYLVYRTNEADPEELVFVDVNGRGQGRLALPRGYRAEKSVAKSLSPTGDRMVIYAGTATGPDSANDLRLGVLNLETGQIEFETALLSAVYPDDLRRLYLTQVAPKIGGDPQYAQAFQEEVASSFLTVWDWSPNGRYLAFAGQIDGPSTDLYLLDTQTGQRRRLSDGLEQVIDISWSPDGRRILNSSSNELGLGMPIHFWSADVTTDTNVDLGLAEAGTGLWVDSEHVLIHANVNGLYDTKDARLVDAVSGATHVIWAGWYGYLSLNLETQTAAVTGCPPEFQTETECGSFEVDLASGVATRTGEASPYDDSGHPPADPALRRLRDGADNTLTLTDDHVEIATASGGVLLPAGNRELWEAGSAFVLSPDHALAFLGVEEALWAIDLQTAEARLIDSDWAGTMAHGYDGGWAAWATLAPRTLIGAVSAVPQLSQDEDIHLGFLLGYDVRGHVGQPLSVYDTATETERTLPLPLRTHPKWEWSVDLAPRRDFVAYYPSDRAALPAWSELGASDYQLWIQDLRTGAFVQRVDLLSSAATKLIAATPPREWELVPAVPVLGVARSLGENLSWSPNGRYLAFSAATHGANADLFVFDSQTQAVTQLTHEKTSVGLPFWSPDSTQIVVRELLDYETQSDSCYFCTPGQTLAVGLDGSVARLTDALAIHLAGWTSPHSFLTFATPFEAPLMYLAEADLQAGTVRDVVPGGFGDAAASIATGDIWVQYFSDGYFRNFSVADGLYHFDRESRTVEPVHLGAEWSGSLAYVPQWDAFAITNNRATSDDPVTLTIMEPDGTVRFQIDGLDAYSLSDLNQRWLLTYSIQSGWLLLGSNGEHVVALGAGCATWLPDRGGVLFVPQKDTASARVLRAANGWRSEPVVLPPGLCGDGPVLSIEGP